MPLISIDLNQARQTAGTFSSSGNTLDDVCGHLQQQWASLSSTWDGDSKYDVAADVNAVLNRGRHCAEFTRERGMKLTQIADRFQAADENKPFDVVPIVWSAIAGVIVGAQSGVAGVLGATLGQMPEWLQTLPGDLITTSSANLVTTYTIGPPTRPDIQHDNGFLDGNHETREPTLGDYLSLAKWKAMLEGSELLRPDLEDANAAYRHFLEGDGTDRTFSYERYVSSDPSGKTTLSNAIRDTQQGVQELYQKLTAENPNLANQEITFTISGGAINAGTNPPDPRFPYPETESWQKTIGAHSLWTSGQVTVTPGNPPVYKMGFDLHAEDRYNFNPGMSDIATGIADRENGEFELCGLGHQYMNTAELTREVTWTDGNLNDTLLSSGPSRTPVSGARIRRSL